MSNYPDNDELETIRRWDSADLKGWFAYIKGVGNYWSWSEPWGWTEENGFDVTERPAHLYHISTGGWSGNEEILDAMRDNSACWTMTWEMTRRGGHYTFAVPH